MKGAYKKFDKNLYAQNDAIARKISKQFIEKKLNLTAMDNPDSFGVDLYLVRNGSVIAYAETEVKNVWNSYDFPYGTVQFPERKGKFVDLDKPTLFCMINNQKTRLLYVWSKDLKSSPLVHVPNKYTAEGELFYQVPIQKVSFYDIEQ